MHHQELHVDQELEAVQTLGAVGCGFCGSPESCPYLRLKIGSFSLPNFRIRPPLPPTARDKEFGPPAMALQTEIVPLDGGRSYQGLDFKEPCLHGLDFGKTPR